MTTPSSSWTSTPVPPGSAPAPADSLAAQLDVITVEELREVGGVKWSTFPEAIGAFIAEMDYGTAPAVRRALHEAVDRGLLGYLPDWLTERVAEACSAWYRDVYGWAPDPARVRPISDVLSGLDAVIRHFSRPGSPVILPTPAYMPFLKRPGVAGREVIQVPLAREDGRWVYDLQALDEAFAAGGHLLVLCNPHNPVGRVLERAELEAISEVVERHGGRVFSDEIHAPLVYAGHRHVPYASVSEAAAAHSITATSTSKAWNLPGLKCAQLILSNDEDAALWRRVGQVYESVASTPGAVASVAAYEEGRDWLTEVLHYLDNSRQLLGDLLAKHLPTVGYLPPEGTYLTLLDCRVLELGDHPARFFLEEAGVAMTDGALCGEAGRGTARFNLAMPRPVMVRAVEQMAEALITR